MKTNLLCWLILLLTAAQAFAQTTRITGNVTDAETRQAVPYATVGVAGKPIGTVANASGKFSLILDSEQLAATDKLIFSCVGYGSLKLTLEEIRNAGGEVELQPQVVNLEEVAVKSPKWRKRVLGKDDREIFTQYNFYSARDTAAHDRLGREVGNIIKLNNRGCYLNDFNLYIVANEFASVKFRLNIYNLKDKVPDSSLLKQDIIFEVKGQLRGWVKVDLQQYDIHLENLDEVAATIQWLESEKATPKSRYLSVSTALSPVHTTVHRDKSAAGWEINAAYASMYFNADCYKTKGAASETE